MGRSAGAGNALGHGRHRGEGADLGEGLAAAGKQEAAAHATTVAAGQPTSQEHGHSSAWTGLPDQSSSSSHAGGQVQVKGSTGRGSPAARRLASSS